MSDSGWWNSSWNPSNWFSGSGQSSGNTPTMMGADFSSMADAGYQVPTSAQMNNPNDFTQSAGGGGGMNWAGLSQGLGKLSDQLKGSTSASNQLQDSKSVSSTVSGGVLSPQAASGGAAALASADTARQQLAQYLILAAMQGKGRGKSGGGLLG